MTAAWDVAGIPVGPGERPLVIAGPCVIENEAFTVEMAHAVKAVADELGVPLIFKSSFDKANRTSGRGFRGTGLDKGLAVLAEVKRQTGLPLLTDIHESWQAAPVCEVCDVLQIPAFLCRQTDLLLAAAATERTVNVKKGQFASPAEMRYVVEKLAAGGARQVVLTERGTSFGYNDLVVDFRSLPVMRSFGVPVVFDATHSVQRPGGRPGASGGRRAYVPYLSRAAAAAGVDGFFLEVHPDPDNAPSDGPNMVRLDDLAAILRDLVAVRDAVKPLPPLAPDA